MKFFYLTLVSCISAFTVDFKFEKKGTVSTSKLNLKKPWSPIRAISLAPGRVDYLNEDQVVALAAVGTKFMDVTDEEPVLPVSSFTLPDKPVLQDVLNSLFPLIETGKLKSTLEKFSSFHNRYFRSSYGVQSAQWLHDTIIELAGNASPNLTITLKKVEHSWSQFSIIARIEKATGSDGPVTIISAHQDSTAGFSPMNSRAPGADDDGSGSMTILEVFRVLVSNGKFNPKGPVEFHWYSAEEGGLLGSKDVASYYSSSRIPVLSVLHIDMDSYTGKQKVVGIVTDFTNPELTQFVRLLVKEYLDIPAVDTRCGYACSDHASWTKYGYKSAFPIEAEFRNSNPFIHTDRDTTANVDFNHMKQFAQLGLSFAFELAHAN